MHIFARGQAFEQYAGTSVLLGRFFIKNVQFKKVYLVELDVLTQKILKFLKKCEKNY